VPYEKSGPYFLASIYVAMAPLSIK
jgi:hypothetical protein